MTMVNEQRDTAEVQTFEFRKEILIQASLEITWDAMLDELGPEGRGPDGVPLHLKVEPWPGGRWYRDLGHNAGHFWAHVQVIKPPMLLELCGPMPMPYPATNHLQYRLRPEGGATHLTLQHRAIGLIPAEHRDGMPEGWEIWVGRIRDRAERAAK